MSIFSVYDLDQAMQIFKPLPKQNLRGQLPFKALVQKITGGKQQKPIIAFERPDSHASR